MNRRNILFESRHPQNSLHAAMTDVKVWAALLGGSAVPPRYATYAAAARAELAAACAASPAASSADILRAAAHLPPALRAAAVKARGLAALARAPAANPPAAVKTEKNEVATLRLSPPVYQERTHEWCMAVARLRDEF